MQPCFYCENWDLMKSFVLWFRLVICFKQKHLLFMYLSEEATFFRVMPTMMSTTKSEFRLSCNVNVKCGSCVHGIILLD